MQHSPHQRFAELISLPDEKIDLIEAALVIAAEAYPNLDVEHYLQKFDALVQEAQEYFKGVFTGNDRVSRLCDFLFVRQGFTGSQTDYYDPRNNFLNEVLDRKIGIPITLAIVYIGVAQSCGWELHGINFPGHFLTKYVGEDGEIILDPFNAKILNEKECKIRYQAIMRTDKPVDQLYLQKAQPREILVRILRNLKNVYMKKEKLEDALSCCDRILMLETDSMIELRERGLLYYKLECFQEAQNDLERLLLLASDEMPTEDIQYVLTKIHRQVSQIN
ncbi:MAG: tetratricopeptide repeat protein [SAR324 cluster bacterium]|nr:tetratricopeptide repeat protein [SAR324 cluster bacterium]